MSASAGNILTMIMVVMRKLEIARELSWSPYRRIGQSSSQARLTSTLRYFEGELIAKHPRFSYSSMYHDRFHSESGLFVRIAKTDKACQFSQIF